MPALLTRMSTEPKVFSAVLIMSAISSGLVMSAAEYAALMPKLFSRPARSASIAALSPKPLMVTLTPAPASALAMPRPIPEVEPVTTADFPLSMMRCPVRVAPRGTRVSRLRVVEYAALQYKILMAVLRSLFKYRVGQPHRRFDRPAVAA